MDLELPKNLTYLQDLSNLDILKALKANPEELLIFLKVCLYNETWCVQHLAFIEDLINFVISQSLQGNIAFIILTQISVLLSTHFELLHSIIPENLTVYLKDGHSKINSLLFICASPILKNLFFDRKEIALELTCLRTGVAEFLAIKEFIETGKISSLWKKWKPDLLALMELGLSWELIGVVTLTSSEMAKYLDETNVVQFLTLSIEQKLFLFEEKCIEKINQFNWGFTLCNRKSSGLLLTIHQFSDECFQSFQRIESLVTGLSCTGNLINHPLFIEMIHRAPNLKYLRLSQTLDYNVQLNNFLNKIQELDLSNCPWIRVETLKYLSTSCKNLNILSLSGNSYIDYYSWGELLNFKQLNKLDLSFCNQITDKDITLILKACTNIEDLNLSHCDHIRQFGFIDLGKLVPHVIRLNVSYTKISDVSLVEIAMHCPLLEEINIYHCTLLTDKGVNAFAKYKPLTKLIKKG